MADQPNFTRACGSPKNIEQKRAMMYNKQLKHFCVYSAVETKMAPFFR